MSLVHRKQHLHVRSHAKEEGWCCVSLVLLFYYWPLSYRGRGKEGVSHHHIYKYMYCPWFGQDVFRQHLEFIILALEVSNSSYKLSIHISICKLYSYVVVNNGNTFASIYFLATCMTRLNSLGVDLPQKRTLNLGMTVHGMLVIYMCQGFTYMCTTSHLLVAVLATRYNYIMSMHVTPVILWYRM